MKNVLGPKNSFCTSVLDRKRNVIVFSLFFLSFWLHQKCGAQFSFATTIASRVLFCRFIPQSLMLTLPCSDPWRYKWKSLGLLCTQNFQKSNCTTTTILLLLSSQNNFLLSQTPIPNQIDLQFYLELRSMGNW